MSAATNSNESYCTFTLASDVTAGGLPSEEEIAKQLESNDPKVRNDFFVVKPPGREGGMVLLNDNAAAV
jgi:hypothetical protein